MYKYLSTVAIIAAFVVLCYTDESNICQRKHASSSATFERDSKNCSVYHICVLGRSMGKLACPSDLVFSITYNVCVRRGQERDDCNKTSSLGGVSDDKLCNDYPNGNNRNPENCHSYIPCFNHTSMTVMQCPDRLHFSLKLQRCVLAKESDCELDDPRCVKKHGNNVDPDDCSRFISCTNGTLMAFQRCGDGTLYYPKNDSCQFAHAVAHDCGNRRIPDTILIPDEDPMCQDVKDDVVPDPSSCYHFFYCHYGRLGPRHRCPAGTAFSTHSKSCEWSAKTSCGGRMRR